MILLLESASNIDHKNEYSEILYPNPFHTMLKFKSEAIINYIEMYNAQGRLIKRATDLPGNTLNTSEYPAGKYIVKIRTKNAVLTERLLKIR